MVEANLVDQQIEILLNLLGRLKRFPRKRGGNQGEGSMGEAGNGLVEILVLIERERERVR